jgi:hypothetical protein
MRHSLCIDMPPTVCASVTTQSFHRRFFVFSRPFAVHGCRIALLVVTGAQAAEGVSVRFDFLQPLVTIQQITAEGRLVFEFCLPSAPSIKHPLCCP